MHPNSLALAVCASILAGGIVFGGSKNGTGNYALCLEFC